MTRAQTPDAPAPRARETAPPAHAALPALASVTIDRWQTLACEACEANGFYLPDWALAIDAFARGRTGLSALTAWSDMPGPARLIGLMPVTSLWRASKIPLPALVSADVYGTVGTPLLDLAAADEAARKLMRQARGAGARALILRNVALDGAAMKTLTRVLETDGLRPAVLHAHARACLDATRDAGELLRDAPGAKKLKELRRQRHRLADHGEVTFDVARTPAEVARALEIFLKLEASGWKAGRGTALLQHEGDAAFIRHAATALAKHGQCQIATLRAGATPVAAAIIVRHQDRAFYFKLGIDERFAKFSPGVQLTLDLTRHLCADPAIAFVDSLAAPDHPMINAMWRGRLAIGDVLIPLARRDPMLALIQAALMLRQGIRAPARHAVGLLRGLRQKR
ncbi:MAG TPA: GNAT family N-acetyltransferase [Bradyrhizobium sp.]|nr:GNAT family N-acetyltransferase [Bradyrhizobium sp.]